VTCGVRVRGFSPLTDEAGLHGSVVVVGEGVEDAAPLHLERLVHDALDDLHHLVVAQLIPGVAWRVEVDEGGGGGGVEEDAAAEAEAEEEELVTVW